MNVSAPEAPSLEIHYAESPFCYDIKQGGRTWFSAHLVHVNLEVGVNRFKMALSHFY